MSAAAERRAHPERHDRGASSTRAGRISGRIGISLASTVSRVIAVPVTQSCLCRLVAPGLDRCDLVLGRSGSGPARALDARDRRVDERPRRRRGRRRWRPRRRARPRRSHAPARRVAGPPPQRQGDGQRGVHERDHADGVRRPDRAGSRRTGRRTSRRSRPTVFAARSRPARPPTSASSAGDERRRGREAEAHDERRRQHDEQRSSGGTARTGRPPTGSGRGSPVEAPGEDQHRPDDHEDRDERAGSPPAGRRCRGSTAGPGRTRSRRARSRSGRAPGSA